MDNFNKDNYLKFGSYFVIVFLLSMILYLMYIDFLSENFFNKKEYFTDVNIDIKLKNINNIKLKNNKLKNINNIKLKNKIIEHTTSSLLDTKAPYILKRDIIENNSQLAITNATCNLNDITTVDNMCNINQNNLYLNSSGNNKFSIRVLSDGYYSKPDSNNHSFYDYNTVVLDTGTPSSTPLSIVRQSYFYFPNNNTQPRTFDISNKYDMSIIKYINNYNKYNSDQYLANYTQNPNYNNFPQNPLISNINFPNVNDIELINTYFSNIENLLLLSNLSTYSPLIYNSGYEFDINHIKVNLINLYNNLFTPNKINNFNMEINDSTNITCIFDSPESMNVYTIELNPKVIITFTNLELKFDPNMPSTITPGSIWSLYYVSKLSPTSVSTSSPTVFTYTDNIKLPIVLPLATPNTNDWKYNTTNGVISYFSNIFKQGSLNNVKLLDPVSMNNITDTSRSLTNQAEENLTKFLKIVGETNMSSITDICVLYDSKTNLFKSWIITNLIDKITNSSIVYPLLYFKTTYSPLICPTGLNYFNNKCIPPCPQGFNYDLGLVCLNNNPNLYLPNSPTCNYLNIINPANLPQPIDPVLSSLFSACDPNYFNVTKSISQSSFNNSQNIITNPSILEKLNTNSK